MLFLKEILNSLRDLKNKKEKRKNMVFLLKVIIFSHYSCDSITLLL